MGCGPVALNGGEIGVIGLLGLADKVLHTPVVQKVAENWGVSRKTEKRSVKDESELWQVSA